jgi:hypothetical protein
MEVLQLDKAVRQPPGPSPGPGGGGLPSSPRGCTAAYAAAGSAMKRARTVRRMIVGTVVECTMLFCHSVCWALLIDFYRVTFIPCEKVISSERNLE